MGEFADDPTLILHDADELRAALSAPDTVPRDCWTVKSLWMIDLINEYAETAFPYNSAVQELAEQRLGIEPQPRSGSVMSRVVYCAQRYRDSDRLRAEGFVPFTVAALEEAHAAGCRIELRVAAMYGPPRVQQLRPRVVNGKLRAMLPRCRSRYVLPMGEPVRLV